MRIRFWRRPCVNMVNGKISVPYIIYMRLTSMTFRWTTIAPIVGTRSADRKICWLNV